MSEPDPQDTDRLQLRPDLRLRAWEDTARPISEFVDAPFEVLARELPRSVLTMPAQPLGALGPLVARLAEAFAVTPEDRMHIVDACNALACVGVEVPNAITKLAAWMPGLTAVEPPFPGRLAAGFAALALADHHRASYVAPTPHDVEGGEVFPGNLHAVLGYSIWLARKSRTLPALQPALDRVAEEVDLLARSQQLDESTVLWIARFAFHSLGGAPLGEVARRANEWLWAAPARLETDRAKAREAPLGKTLCAGAFVIEHRLKGIGWNRLYRGVERATNAQVLVSYAPHRRTNEVEALRAAVSYEAPGLAELIFAGLIDGGNSEWCIVERASGTWLPEVVGPANPWTAPRKAIELGVSAGRIMLGTLSLGQLLTKIRPEVMWAQVRDGHYEVTAITPRPFELFVRTKADAVMMPLFMHQYRDPLSKSPTYSFDDRSLTFTLATMIAEWTIGTYPLLQTWGNETCAHMEIEAPRALQALLERGLSATLDERPPLAQFVEDLAKL